MKSVPAVVLSVLISWGVVGQECGFDWRMASPYPTPDHIQNVAYGGGRFIAVGEHFLTSGDGVSWTFLDPGTHYGASQIVWGAGKWLALNDYGMLISDDGRCWEGYSLTGSLQGNSFSEIYSTGDTLFAAGYDGLYLSRDAMNWSKCAMDDALNAMHAVAYGAGLYVAAGYGGKVQTSPDGVNWTVQSVPSQANFKAATFGGGRFVLVGEGETGTILTSADGVQWTAVGGASSWTSFRQVVYGAGRFVAPNAGMGECYVSADGLTWTAVSVDNEFLPSGFAYGAKLFLAATGQGGVWTSPDGVAWTRRSSVVNIPILQAVTFSEEKARFVATGGGTLASSADGLTWTASRVKEYTGLASVAHGGGIFVAVGSGWETYEVYSSPDGVSWTKAPTVPTQEALKGVCYGAGSFVAVGDNGIILTSPDGRVWTVRDPGYRDSLSGVAYGAGRFIAVGGNGAALVSLDGTAWAQQPFPNSGTAVSVAYGGGRFVAAGYQKCFTSRDGLAWEAVSVPWTGSGVFFLENRFVAVARDLFQSPLLSTSEDGQAWTTVWSLLPSNIMAMAYGQGLLIGVGGDFSGSILWSEGCHAFATSISPTSGPVSGGTPVTILGGALSGATAVFFGLTPAASFEVNSDGQVTAISPPSSAGRVKVRVDTPAGLTATTQSPDLDYYFQCEGPVPAIEGIEAKGTPFRLIVTGQGFCADSIVLINGVAAPQTLYKGVDRLVVKGGNALRAMVPKCSEGSCKVIVTNTQGQCTSDKSYFCR